MTAPARDVVSPPVHDPRSPARPAWPAFVTLAALTATEVRLASGAASARRATALCGLLILKVGLVMVLCLRADLRRRRPSRLAAVALLVAAGFALVLMLEAAFQARLR